MESYEFLITDYRKMIQIKDKFNLSLNEDDVIIPSIIYVVKVNDKYESKIIDGIILSQYIRYLNDMWE